MLGPPVAAQPCAGRGGAERDLPEHGLPVAAQPCDDEGRGGAERVQLALAPPAAAQQIQIQQQMKYMSVKERTIQVY
mgnify:CR=1 FL=1